MRPSGSIRQRSANSFNIRYGIGKNALTGKRIRADVTFEGTYQEAKTELRRLLRTVDTREHVKPNKITTGEYLLKWQNAIKLKVSPKTFERYEEIIRNNLIPAFGKSRLQELGEEIIQDQYSDWETTGRRDKKPGGLAPRTRVHIHRILKQALKHAVKIKLIPSNPADYVIAPRAQKKIVKTLSIAQSLELLDYLKSSNLYAPVFLALATGMRRGEICALRWQHLDFDKATIRVIESVEQVKQNLRFKTPKTEKFRAIKLPQYALEELRSWKDKQAARLTELGVVVDDNIFICGRSWDGGVVKPDSLSAEFWEIIRKAATRNPNIPIVRLHDLRHSHATQLLEEGIHMKITQERLGHSQISTTIDLYSHVTQTMQDSATDKMDEVFSKAKGQQKGRLLAPGFG